MLHNYFDKTFLINLDRRPDRLAIVNNECVKFGVKFERISAIDGSVNNFELIDKNYYWNNNAASLSMTYLKILLYCKENNINSVLFLEDDVEFDLKLNDRLFDIFIELPKDWELLYFGSNHNKPYIPYSKNLVRCSRTYSTHCVAINSTVYDILIEDLSKLDKPIDCKLADLIQSRGKSYSVFPNIAFQRVGYSDILNQKVDYSFLKK